MLRDRNSPLYLAWRRFLRHRPGVWSALVLLLLYLMALFAGFIAPYSVATQHVGSGNQPPQRIHFFHEGQLRRPFVYALQRQRDPVTFLQTYTQDKTQPVPIRFFVQGDTYNFYGLRSNLHLFGVENGTIFLMGSDKLGRDIFSRTVIGSQISLTVGIVGVAISFVIGILMGGISGYYGGRLDLVIQRIIEVLLSIPRLPILLALATIIPANWPSTYVYMGIVTVLAFIGWASLARVVRGQVIALRDIEYVTAAKALGQKDLTIITRHITPNISSYLIIAATLALPGYILGESTLSFLGLGVKEPMASWGLLLADAQDLSALSQYPWLLWPGAFIVLSVLCYNFVGDALRDAADVRSVD